MLRWPPRRLTCGRVSENLTVAMELASLDAKIEARKKRIDAAQRDARAIAEKAGAAVKSARRN